MNRAAWIAIWLLLALNRLTNAQTATPTPDFDANRDGIVDAMDLILFQQHWQSGERYTPTPVPDTPTPTATHDDTYLTILLPGNVQMDFAVIPSGTFEMGFPSQYDSSWADHPDWQRPVHTVTIGKGFYMGKTEVTVAQWKALMNEDPSQFGYLGEQRPVERVSWNDCQLFIAAMNELGQGTFRLPTEAEWEYACRAGTDTLFHFGDSNCSPTGAVSCDLDNYAWWSASLVGQPAGTQEVARLLPNPWGMYDLYGNVYEWCQDDWHTNYNGAPADGSSWGDGTASDCITRGAWRGYTDARKYTSFFRVAHARITRHDSIGFRLVREME